MLTSRITESENCNFKTNLKTNTDNHNGDLNLCFLVVVVSFTRFKWLTLKE